MTRFKFFIIIYPLLMSVQSAFAQQADSTSTQKKQLTKKQPYVVQKKATFLSLTHGMSGYLGDLGGNKGAGKGFMKDFNFKKRTSFTGVAFSYLKNEKLGIRLSYTAGRIEGSDQDATFTSQSDPAYLRYKRNLNFRTKISEISLLVEAYPLKFLKTEQKYYHWSFQPYVMLGLGRYKFNPQGTYYDPISGEETWVDLQPLQTEGQGMNEYPDRKYYKLGQINMPYGLGIRYALGKKTSLAFEYVGRKLFTDYLDDVSTNYIDPSLYDDYLGEDDATIAKAIHNKSNLVAPTDAYKTGDKRGNSKRNDFYYSFNLKFSVQINRQRKQVKPTLTNTK